MRFEISRQQANWQQLVEECLTIFTPWSTTSSCWVPTHFEPNGWTASRLLRKILKSRDLDRVEMYRCHAFIDPCCYGRLAKGMGLDARRDRLSVPKFFLNDEKSGGKDIGKSAGFGDRRPNPPELTEQERGLITARLQTEAVARQRTLPQVLYIVSSGEECSRWDLARKSRQRVEIQDGTKLLEIWTENEGERVLLATHLVRYTSSQGIAESKHVIDLDSGRKLFLHTIPVDGGAVIELECNPLRDLPGWREILGVSFNRRGALARYALGSACLLLLGWVLGTVWRSKDLAQQRAATERVSGELARERAMRAALEHQLENEQSAKSLASVLLVSGITGIRGPEVTKEPVVSISSNTRLVNLRLPVSQGGQHVYSAVLAPFLAERELLKENFLEATTKANGSEISFPVPASLLENGKRYVVTLYQVDRTGRQERIDLFTFYFVKK